MRIAVVVSPKCLGNARNALSRQNKFQYTVVQDQQSGLILLRQKEIAAVITMLKVPRERGTPLRRGSAYGMSIALRAIAEGKPYVIYFSAKTANQLRRVFEDLGVQKHFREAARLSSASDWADQYYAMIVQRTVGSWEQVLSYLQACFQPQTKSR